MQHLTAQSIFRTLTALLLVLMFQSVYAVLPPTMNYQGHLTDSSGVPIDGPVSMSFAIYDVDSGGTALWSDTRSVTVDQGVFSVELGGGGNPFPVGLFEDPLWMGLTVGSDAEMTPRRPISSTAYSFKADDANTLEGVSAGTLDQSAHVTDTANPHAVTTGQIGAADAAALSAHTSDTTNPHSVTAAQAGAASSSDFTTHTGDSAAHHTRFTSGEAVAAMGTIGDSNPLHHDKYTDANVVTAMLANDGAGSTLDSDKVDGLEASELIDAAQDEVRTPINSLPYTISTPGSYYLTDNLDGSSGGIDITTGDVALDLMGFTIDGGGTIADYGIYFNGQSNVTIRNGSIKNFGWAGIMQSDTTAVHGTITDIQAIGNGTLGTASGFSGILLYSTNSHIERCTAVSNGGDGIYAYAYTKLINNTAHDNSGTCGICGGAGSVLQGNTASNNTSTYAISGGSGSNLIGNTAYDNTANGILGDIGSTLINNTAYSNTGYGIYGLSSSTLKQNSAYGNGSYGIRSSTGATVANNTSHSNVQYGIYTGNGNTIENNTVYGNGQWGIYSFAGSTIKDNTIYLNNGSGSTGVGGLHVYYDSRVTGNTLDGNQQYNIYVYGYDNSIENNLVTDSQNGIFFNTSGNFYGNNRASGNNINFNLNGTSQITSTYLPNINF